MIKIAGKSMWWIVLVLIPFVNIIAAILIWMAIAAACRKPSWIGILILVPLVNLAIPPYLAFSNNSATA
jgi:uncharacterized membrane protein YoaK (UPF0700 family)